MQTHVCSQKGAITRCFPVIDASDRAVEVLVPTHCVTNVSPAMTAFVLKWLPEIRGGAI